MVRTGLYKYSGTYKFYLVPFTSLNSYIHGVQDAGDRATSMECMNGNVGPKDTDPSFVPHVEPCSPER